MAEDNKKTEKVTFDKAASSLKKLSDAVKECKKQIQGFRDGSVSATEGIINIIAAAGSAHEAIGTLSGFVKGFGKSWKEGWNTKVVEKFSKSVSTCVEKMGKGLQKLPDHVKTLVKS